MTRWIAVLSVLAFVAAPAPADPPAKLSPEQTQFFETKVRPIPRRESSRGATTDP
jgi:hypothetical protein